MQWLDSIDRRGLAINVVAAVALAALVNGLIFLFGWNQPQTPRSSWFAPPDWFVGAVWVILFACLGAARWLAVAKSSKTAARSVLLLALFCAAYPIYTFGLEPWPGLAGNIATVLAASVVAVRLRGVSGAAAALVSLIVVWVSYATLIVLSQLRLIG